ncbi:MAG: DUF4129 domain-containing protein [Candidatus Promineifilaceae bacterium]|nr:DUF4129 domain-containing protein [Candidatus Promineifilaceae bacterium]
MTNKQRLKLLAYLSLGLVALVLLTAGMPNLELQTGGILMEPLQPTLIFLEEGEATGEPVFVNPFNLASLLALASLAFIALYSAYRWPEVRAALIVLLLFTGLILGMIYLYHTFGDPPAPPEEEVQRPPAVQEERLSQELLDNPPDWLDPITVVVTIVLLVAGAVIARFLWRHPWKQPDRGTLEMVTAEAEAALDELRAGAAVRDAILRCYLEMNQGLRQRLGLVREEGMTPREFEEELTRAGLPHHAVQRLTRLFESVRYGRQSGTETDREEAIASLEAIIEYARAQEERRRGRSQNVQASPA